MNFVFTRSNEIILLPGWTRRESFDLEFDVESNSRNRLSLPQRSSAWDQAPSGSNLISHNLSLKSFCRCQVSQIPYKSVNLSFAVTKVKNKISDSCGNRLWQNDLTNRFAKTIWQIIFVRLNRACIFLWDQIAGFLDSSQEFEPSAPISEPPRISRMSNPDVFPSASWCDLTLLSDTIYSWIGFRSQIPCQTVN